MIFFQLIATKLLSFQWNSKEDNVVCVRTSYEDENKVEKCCFQGVWQWEGMKFRSVAHSGGNVSFKSLMVKYYPRNPTHTKLPKL